MPVYYKVTMLREGSQQIVERSTATHPRDKCAWTQNRTNVKFKLDGSSPLAKSMFLVVDPTGRIQAQAAIPVVGTVTSEHTEAGGDDTCPEVRDREQGIHSDCGTRTFTSTLKPVIRNSGAVTLEGDLAPESLFQQCWAGAGRELITKVDRDIDAPLKRVPLTRLTKALLSGYMKKQENIIQYCPVETWCGWFPPGHTLYRSPVGARHIAMLALDWGYKSETPLASGRGYHGFTTQIVRWTLEIERISTEELIRLMSSGSP
jgi:hypothetical protein